ncbi:hypothetical protein FWF93_03410 [Candidatus Saccharibacteria bacterium]|jgi:hypothetical protein|nr:hypothetical protein [Candidatus Saccharibacteria bacterium]
MGRNLKVKKYRRKRIVSWSIFAVALLAALTIIFQVSWPYDKFLPGQKIDGLDVGLKNHSEVKELLEQEYREQTVDLKVRDRIIGSTTVDEIGIQVNSERQIETAEFPLKQRMIPGYFIYKIFFQNTGVPQLSLDTTKTTGYLDRNYATVCTVSPINATIVVEDDRLRLNADEPGLICDERKVIGNILVEDLTLAHPLSVKLDGKEIEALVREKDLREIFDITRAQLTNGIVFEIDSSKTISARYNDLVKWLNIETDIFGHVKISYSDDKIREYLDRTISSFVKRLAGVTVVSEHNGMETSRKLGTEGRDLDYDAMIIAVKKYLETNIDPDTKLAVTSRVTSPIVRYKRSFSKNIAGLAALFSNRLAGTNHSLIVEDLSGGGLNNGHNINFQFESKTASKLFVAYFMYDELKNNTGNVTESCFYKILNSYDVDCKNSFINNPQVNFAGKMQLFNGADYRDGKIIVSTFGLAALLSAIQTNIGDQSDNSGGIKQLGASLIDTVAREGAAAIINDEADPVVAASIVKQGNGAHIIVAVNGGSRENLKETIALIDSLFTPDL